MSAATGKEWRTRLDGGVNASQVFCYDMEMDNPGARERVYVGLAGDDMIRCLVARTTGADEWENVPTPQPESYKMVAISGDRSAICVWAPPKTKTGG